MSIPVGIKYHDVIHTPEKALLSRHRSLMGLRA